MRSKEIVGSASFSAPPRTFLKALLLLWLITLVIAWAGKTLLHWSPDSWYPFFPWNNRFTDFTDNLSGFQYFHRADFFQHGKIPYAYPAPVGLVLECFYLLGRYSVAAYVCLCLLVFGIAGGLLARAMHSHGLSKIQSIAFVGATLVLSYPFWFMVDRGNIEIVNWVLVALGVAAYWNKRWYLAGAFIGLAISFKIFPFVFLGLLLSARKYGAILFGLLVCAVATLVSTWLFGPTFHAAASGIAAGLQSVKPNYMLRLLPLDSGFDHSLFTVFKVFTFKGLNGQELHYLPIFNRYMVVTAIAGIVIYFWKIRKLPPANQILALTVASVLLPPWSSDYTLTHLYIPWAVLVLLSISLPRQVKVPGLAFAFLCLAYLMAPESYVIIYGVRFAGQLKAVVLLILFFVSISYPFAEPTESMVTAD
jgi:hypothetical protein